LPPGEVFSEGIMGIIFSLKNWVFKREVIRKLEVLKKPYRRFEDLGVYPD